MFLTALFFQTLTVLFLDTGRVPVQTQYGWSRLHTEISSQWVFRHVTPEDDGVKRDWRTNPAFTNGWKRWTGWGIRIELTNTASIERRAINRSLMQPTLTSAANVGDVLESGRLIIGGENHYNALSQAGSLSPYAKDQYAADVAPRLFYTRVSPGLIGSNAIGVVTLNDSSTNGPSGDGGGIGGGDLPGVGGGNDGPPVIGGGTGGSGGSTGGGFDPVPEPSSILLIGFASLMAQLRRPRRRRAA